MESEVVVPVLKGEVLAGSLQLVHVFLYFHIFIIELHMFTL